MSRARNPSGLPSGPTRVPKNRLSHGLDRRPTPATAFGGFAAYILGMLLLMTSVFVVIAGLAMSVDGAWGGWPGRVVGVTLVLGGAAAFADGIRVRRMEPLGVHHVSINVSDPVESIAFYTEVLGGTVRDDRPDFGIGGAWIDLGDTQVHLIESAVPPNMGQHFAILVEDVDAVVRELRSRGFDVEDARIVGPDRQTFIDDPDGNAVELHQVGTATS